MRVTNCPDCGEVVEIPLPTGEYDDTEVTCQICGLSGPASEWQAYAPEDDDSLLGRPLAAATMPESVPKSWALRVEQLEEIREVVVELAHQIRLLRQALDELNLDLPPKIKSWFDKWHSEYLPSQTTPAGTAEYSAVEPAANPPRPSPAKSTQSLAGRKTAAVGQNERRLW